MQGRRPANHRGPSPFLWAIRRSLRVDCGGLGLITPRSPSKTGRERPYLFRFRLTVLSESLTRFGASAVYLKPYPFVPRVIELRMGVLMSAVPSLIPELEDIVQHGS